MASVRITPLPDSVTLRGSWQVKKSGNRVSKHVKKSTAIRKARSVADSGDDVYYHGLDGRVLRKHTKR